MSHRVITAVDALRARYALILRQDSSSSGWEKARRDVRELPTLIKTWLAPGRDKPVVLGNGDWFGLALKICAAASRADVGGQVLALMKHKTLRACDYECVMRWTVASGNAAAALQVLSTMKRERVVPERMTFVLILNCIAKSADPEKWALALRVYRDAQRERGIGALQTALLGCASTFRQCITVLREMNVHGAPVEAYTYNIVLRIAVANGEAEGGPEAAARAEREVLAVLDAMRGRGIAPSIVTYTTWLGLYRYHPSGVEGIQRVMRCVEESGVRRNTHFCAALVAACAEHPTSSEAVQLAKLVVSSALLSGLATPELFRGLMKLYAARGDAAEAETAMQLMVDNKVFATKAVQKHYEAVTRRSYSLTTWRKDRDLATPTARGA